MTKSTKCTNGGCVPEGLIREAKKLWKREQLRIGKAAPKTFISYVAMVPAPPVPNTPAYYRCVNSWYMCMMKASQLDSWYRQEAQLRADRLAGEGVLTTLLDSYASCLGGFPT
jgi:hypothetical protein